MTISFPIAYDPVLASAAHVLKLPLIHLKSIQEFDYSKYISFYHKFI